MTSNSAEVQRYLAARKSTMQPIIRTDDHAIVLDLSRGSELYGEPLRGIDVEPLGALIDRAMADAGTGYAFGRYAETRDLYHNDNFSGGAGGERRDVHLGIDVFCAHGTVVYSPLDGVLEIAENNDAELDYGPMLVVRHETDNAVPFYLLYGHLTLGSLAGKRIGERVVAGDSIAAIGEPPVNGNWPPHLHLQIIVDLKNLGRDFPGVAFNSELDYWLELSPSPAVFFPQLDATVLDARNDNG